FQVRLGFDGLAYFTDIEVVLLAQRGDTALVRGDIAGDDTEHHKRGAEGHDVFAFHAGSKLTSSPTRIPPCFVSLIRLVPKLTSLGSSASRRNEASVLSGSLPARSPVNWSVVVTMHRAHRPPLRRMAPPTLRRGQASSANGAQPSITMLGRN